MYILQRLEDFESNRAPLILTIGNFDGVHRGHQVVLRRCQELTGASGQLIVLTFSNHPSQVLRPHTASPLICSLPQRLQLLEQMGVETTIILPFTLSIAGYTAATFLEKVRQFIPFHHLVLGYDAVMGKNREGNQALISALADMWDFDIDYLPQYRYEGTPVSSTQIRHFLQQGYLTKVEDLLGRPYSIYFSLFDHDETTIHLKLTNLCLPPPGIYSGWLWLKKQCEKVKANLTIHPLDFNKDTPCTIDLVNRIDFINEPLEFIFMS